MQDQKFRREVAHELILCYTFVMITARRILHTVLLISMLAAGACIAYPTDPDARAAITGYYNELGYEVTGLKLGRIEKIPVSQREFMGTPAYSIEIKSITLASAGTRGAEQEHTFKNARIQIREKRDQPGAWIVFNVAKIPVT